MDPPTHITLLSRTWKAAGLIICATYVIINLIIGYKNSTDNFKLCNSTFVFPSWTKYLQSFQAGGFLLNSILQLKRMCIFGCCGSTNNTDSRVGIYFSAFIVAFLPGISSLLTIFWDFGGVCEDTFGVLSPAARWSEWIACVPFLLYLVLTIDDKEKIIKRDLLLIFSMFLCLLFGLFMNLEQPIWQGCVFLVLSLLAWMAVIFQFLSSRNDFRHSFQQYKLAVRNSITYSAASTRILNMKLRRYYLTIAFIILTSAIVFIYFLGAIKVLPHAIIHAIFLICDVLGKLMFSSIAIDFHIDSQHQDSARLISEEKNNEARKTFLRYVFHEVRVPLNSITMGVHLLANSPAILEDDQETVTMMREAASFMGSTLNDVLSLQKMEEGKLELKFVSFSFENVVNTVLLSLQGQITNKNVNIHTQISKQIPLVLGDRFKIEHVLANLLSNAIKFLPQSGHVYISIKSRPLETSKEHFCEVEVSVIDEGPGISTADQKLLFMPFMQINPEVLQQGRGSGLGLSICKQIVELHGGVISCQSTVGVGSTFSFTIPFRFPLTTIDELQSFDKDEHISKSSIRKSITIKERWKSMSLSNNSSSHSHSHSTTLPDNNNFFRRLHASMSLPSLSSAMSKSFSNRTSIAQCPASGIGLELAYSNLTNGALPPPTSHSSSLPLPLPLLLTTNSNKCLNTRKNRNSVHRFSDASYEEKSSHNSNSALSSLVNFSKGSNSNVVVDVCWTPEDNHFKCLIVDDVHSNRKMLGRLLQLRSIESDVAMDGSEAVNIISDNLTQYKIVFMDNMMPNLCGVDATRILRHKGYRYLIIGLTGNAMDDDLAAFEQAGADLVLSKPLRVEDFNILVDNIRNVGLLSRNGMKLVVCDATVSWVIKT